MTPSNPAVGPAAPDVVLVANANASGAAGPQEAARLATAMRDAGARVEVLHTRTPAEVAPVWHTARRVVLLGGDGTLHAAVNLPGPPPEVALIPAGRANNVARCLGIPTEPDAAARLAVSGHTRAIDLIEAQAGGRRVVAAEGLSVGFLALARSHYHASNSANVPAAIAAVLAALVHFHPLDVRISGDHPSHERDVCQLFVSNMPLFGPHFRVAPHADPTDGLLDVLAVEAPGRRAIPGMLARLRSGRHVGRPETHEWRAERLRIETRGASPTMADAEDLGFGPVDVRVLPAALAIVSEAG